MFDLDAIQGALRDFGLDGWLLYDFRGSNALARRVLDLEHRPAGSRRFFYAIPARGRPKKLVHRIEAATLDHLPGETAIYLRWQELEGGVAELLRGMDRVAMEYSPRSAIPYISRVDAGTVELARACGVEVVPSGDLIQLFEAAWDDAQWALHLEAERHTTAAYELAWGLIADACRGGGSIAEGRVQAAILDHFRRNGLTADSPPIVAAGPHSSDPHYEPRPGPDDTPIHAGELVLIDLWAKVDRPRAVYSDLTRVGFVGDAVPGRLAAVFGVVARARDAVIAAVRAAFAAGRPLRGYEVDRASREVVERAGYGANFVHRTGHSVGQEVHGNGANLDDLETRDDRLVLPRTCFSVEPGIYLPGEFGVRSEVNVFVDRSGQVHVTGGLQAEIVPILRDA